MPPLPTWDGLHPLVVHFPIALLLVAPLLVIIGVFLGARGRPWLTAALVLMGLGTLATWIAVASGEAAGELADRGGPIDQVLERHEEMAESVRAIFTGLMVIFAAGLLVPRLLKRELARAVRVGSVAAFLVAYAAGAVYLANAAHLGGRLVHELGVHAVVAGGSSSGPYGVARGEGDDD